jgi:hypothetical protein
MADSLYWMLECFRKPLVGGRTIRDFPDVPGVGSWVSGERFRDPIPQPITLYWYPENEDAPPKALYKAGIPMMKAALHKAFLDAGVDNLDTYALEIRSETKPEIDRTFVAFNVVGTIAAADMKKSKYNTNGGPAMVSVDFAGVTVDPEKARDALLFRLAQNVSAIVVHDRVKKKLETTGFGLSFIPPEQWVG